MENKKHILSELDAFISSLNQIKTAIIDDDKSELIRLLSIVKQNKLTMQTKEPENH